MYGNNLITKKIAIETHSLCMSEIASVYIYHFPLFLLVGWSFTRFFPKLFLFRECAYTCGHPLTFEWEKVDNKTQRFASFSGRGKEDVGLTTKGSSHTQSFLHLFRRVCEITVNFLLCEENALWSHTNREKEATPDKTQFNFFPNKVRSYRNLEN